MGLTIVMVGAIRGESPAIAALHATGKTISPCAFGTYEMNKAKWLCKSVQAALSVAVAVVPACAYGQDSWTSPDKANHFAMSYVMSSVAGKYHGPKAGAALALIPGVAKELSDLGGSGTPSVKDMTWNVVGAVAGAVLPVQVFVAPAQNGGVAIHYITEF